MKFSLIRYGSLFLVFCFCICLMCSFVSASSLLEGTIPFVVQNGELVTFDESAEFVSLLRSIYSDKIALDIFIGGSLYVHTDPALYSVVDNDDGTFYLLSQDPLLIFAVYSDTLGAILLTAPEGFAEDTVVDVTVSVSSDPNSDLLSDLWLIGASFLETVQGIVLTITKNPLLLLTVVIFFVGGCIAIFSRLLSKN